MSWIWSILLEASLQNWETKRFLSLIYNTLDAPAHFILESDWQRFGIIFASTFGFTWVFKIPLLCIKYGALSFFSFYALVLTFVAIPMAYIQLSLGQYSSLPPLQLFTRRTPLYKGLGVLLTVVRVAVIYVVFDDFMVQDLINSVFVLLRTHSNGETWADCRLPTNFLNCYDRLIICKDRYSNYNSSVFYQYLGECREVFIEGKLNPNYTYEQAVIIMTYGHAALRETPIETNLHQALDSYPNLIIVTSVLFSMMFMLFFGVHGVNKLGLVGVISSTISI
ncbi:unnamed protein product [Bursaphelenchus okinawaensis]|uniref:Uncharacterized protein n=1 Tax=Bursaphelenchus okinawaensis TaxID=465554 RepID=A0A811KCP8_9BILA|nr:unnamed protein product [Bursaphelenchus okinawaensis]CAG9097118.1 unnamed protein product [Bursaphelenchus okinawaensis]